jgi:hypothetical protein
MGSEIFVETETEAPEFILSQCLPSMRMALQFFLQRKPTRCSDALAVHRYGRISMPVFSCVPGAVDASEVKVQDRMKRIVGQGFDDVDIFSSDEMA